MPRREKVFLFLVSIFMTSLVMANIIGITKFFEFRVPLWGYTVMVPVGILPYPVTFLATDLISELYGRRRANFVVLIGFVANVFLVLTAWLGSELGTSTIWLRSLAVEDQWQERVYPHLWFLVLIGVKGSMAAYLVAQFVDVQIFHFWKRVTKGRHLWLRNNLSTMSSQLIDSAIILWFVFGAQAADGSLAMQNPFTGATVHGYAALGVHIFNAYLFKVFFAACDTPFAYFFKWLLRPIVGGPDEGETRYEGD